MLSEYKLYVHTRPYYAKQLGESEKYFVCLALQDMLDRDGLKITVEVKSFPSHYRQQTNHRIAAYA